MKATFGLVATGLASLACAASIGKRDDASTPITIKGNAFFRGNDRFYIRGVDYQFGGSSNVADPLADEAADACTRDIKNFQDLGLNTIRVYTVDNSKSHDKCMNALEKAGIYLILDVNTPTASLRRDKPAQSYNAAYLQNVFATIDAFAKYPNTMAYLSGNEVINDDVDSTGSAPYIKATTLDMKQYIADRKYRHIPVGYSGADVSKTRYETAEFLNCGSDDERSDFFAFNDYSWCDPSSFTTSGWDQKVQLFSNYSIPIFLSEFGCITNGRQFEEIAALYSDKMTHVYSGGLVYEYANEANGYGLGDLNGNTYTPNKDYAALKKALAGTPAPQGDGGYRADPGSPSQCPAASDTWSWGNDTLPAMPDGAKALLGKGAGVGKGLSAQTQDAGGPTTTWAQTGSGKPSTTDVNGASSSQNASPMMAPEFSYAPLVLAGAWALSTVLGNGFVLL